MSLQAAILEQVKASVENLVAVATGELEKKVEALENKVAKLEASAKTAPARAAKAAAATVSTQAPGARK